MLWKTDVALKDSAFFLYFLEEADFIVDLKVDVEAKAPAIRALL